MNGVATRRALVLAGFAGLLLLLAPRMAIAQSVISGIVRDTSGAVLPGVTGMASVLRPMAPTRGGMCSPRRSRTSPARMR
jgi:hypothetical protein